MKRIVSLLPSATDLIGALGLESWLVGVSHECDWPPAVRSLPRLTRSLVDRRAAPAEVDALVRRSLHAHRSLYALDSDLLQQLQPDVILTQELCEVCAVSYDQVLGAVRVLRQAGGSPAIVSLEPRSLADVLQTVQVVADLLEESDRGRVVVAALQQRIAQLRERGSAFQPKASVLVLEWPDPPFVGAHWVPEMVEIAGGVNAPVQEALRGRPSRRTAWAEIQASDPDVIIVGPCGYDRERSQEAIQALNERAEWRSLRAVQAGQVFPIDANSYLSRPGPRLVEGIAELQQILYQVAVRG